MTSGPSPAVLAHRGFAARARENTLEAFLEARRVGADGVELDVRRSADGGLVVHHDAVVAGTGPVAELSVADLPLWVPLLGAALDVCDGLMVNIEIKNLPTEPGWDPAEALAGAVAALVGDRDVRGQVVVSSFTLATIDAVRSADAAIATAWLTPSRFDQLQALATVREHGHAGLHPHHDSVTDELVDKAHRTGLMLNTWTVDDPERARALAGKGVDAIVTNAPDVVLSALGRG